MKFDSVTIKDIAKALGLSTSTVSRALRGSHEISSRTEALVKEYAEKINYRPNPAALSLKEKRTRSIGVVTIEVANNFFSQAIDGVESIAYSKGYHVIFSQTHESALKERQSVQHLASRGVDGLLISLSLETQNQDYLKELQAKGMPIVFFDRVSDEMDTPKVSAHNYQGAFRATEHLILQGYQKIAHITSASGLSITWERLKGFQEALQQYRLPFDEHMVKYCGMGATMEQEVEQAIGSLYAEYPAPDALFAAGDRLTTACLSLLKKNYSDRFPGFIGFTNTPVGHLFSPALSVVRQPAFEMGRLATELLIEMIESKRPVTAFQHLKLDTELVIRESSLRQAAAS